MLGSLINGGAVLAGGLLGHFAGKLFSKEQQESLSRACGVSVMFIAVAGAMEGMLSIDGGRLLSGKAMFVVLCLTLGTIAGELMGIERGFENFGIWLRERSGNSGDTRFLDAFVTASLTICIGAMAIVGAIQEGITGDFSTLAVKSVLDFFIIAIFTSSMGKGAVFAAIPVFILEASVTLFAKLLAPVMTELAISYISLIGAVLIFCIGVNLVWEKRFNVANMLPAIIFAVISAYLPWGF